MKCPCGKTHGPQEETATIGESSPGPGWAVRGGLVRGRRSGAQQAGMDPDQFMNERGRAWGPQDWRIAVDPTRSIHTGTGIHEAVEDLTRSVRTFPDPELGQEYDFAPAPFHPQSPIEEMRGRGQIGSPTAPMSDSPEAIAAIAATWANTVRQRNQDPYRTYTLNNHGPYWFRIGTRQRVGPALTVTARRLGQHPGDVSLDPDRGPERAIRFWVAFERPDHRIAGQFWILAYGRNWWAEYRNDTSPAAGPTFLCHASAGPAAELRFERS